MSATIHPIGIVPKRTATLSALLCGDGLTRHLHRAVLAHMAAYGAEVTLLEVDRILIKAAMQRSVDASGPDMRPKVQE